MVVAIAVLNKTFLKMSTSIALRVLLSIIFPAVATVTALAEQCEPALASSIDLTPHINGWGINKRNLSLIHI